MNPQTVRRLLDPAEAARLLDSLPGSHDGAAMQIESVWAKPGRHFSVCYRTAEGLASLCIVSEPEAARARRRLGRSPRSPEGTSFALAAADVLVQRFPCDYRLEQLAACMEPDVVHETLGDRSVDACEVAAYRAGMRCQIRFLSGGVPRAYGKVAFDREPGRRSLVHRQTFEATASAALRLPAPLGTVSDLGLDLVRAVDGRSLHDALSDAPDAALVAATGRALAELHATVPAPADRVHGCTEELELVRSWTAWMATVEPSLAAPLGRATALLADGLPAGAPDSFAHRDFHDKQVLLGASNLWLLDIDTACTGDRELDLGNFLAHLFLRGVQWQRVASHRALEEAAAEAYGADAQPDLTRWYRRASLLRLACVYHLRPRWRPVVPALLEEAFHP